MHVVHNERIKLTAAWLDRASTAALTVGVVAPLAAAYFGTAGLPLDRDLLRIGVVLWTLSAIGLHAAARQVLGRLR